MSFDWMSSECPPVDPSRFLDQHVNAIEERARLLYNLRFDSKEATRRIQAALDWEFDGDIAATPRPGFYKDVAKIVKGVYTQAKRGGDPKPDTGRRARKS